MRRPFILLAFCFALAGCGQAPPPPGGTGPTTSPADTGPLAISFDLPDWTLGQGWTYAVEVPGEPTRTFVMMVAEDRDDLWVVATDDRTQALHHAVYSTNPMLGRIGKATLAPFQGGAPVQMFRFPLTDGLTWEGDFFGEPMTFTADYAGDIDVSNVDEARGLGRFAEGFRITAEAAGGRTVQYDYVPSAEWFASFELLDAAGEREIKLTLLDIDAAYNGPYHFFRASDALVETVTHADTDGITTSTLMGDVPEDRAELVALGIVFRGRAGTTPPSLNASLKDPGGTVVHAVDLAGATQVTELWDGAGAAGTWAVDLRLIGSLDAEIRLVGISVFAEGTL